MEKMTKKLVEYLVIFLQENVFDFRECFRRKIRSKSQAKFVQTQSKFDEI